jgi:hypothetical protein
MFIIVGILHIGGSLCIWNMSLLKPLDSHCYEFALPSPKLANDFAIFQISDMSYMASNKEIV